MSSARPPGPGRGFDEIDELAGEYVLGTLPYLRRQEVEQRMTTDVRLRAAVQSWQEQLLPLSQLAPPVEPSAQLWQRIETSLQSQSQNQKQSQKQDQKHRPAESAAAAASAAKPDLRADPPATPQPSVADSARRASGTRAAPLGWWSSLQLWRGLAGTGFAATAVMAAVLLTRTGALPGGAPSTQAVQYVVVLVAPGGNAPGWVVQASSTQQLSLVPVGSTPVPPEKALQFWTKGDTWTAPVSLGLVRPGEAVQVPLDKLPPLQPNQLFELTLEPPGGSPTGKPTGPIQFIGRAVKVI